MSSNIRNSHWLMMYIAILLSFAFIFLIFIFIFSEPDQGIFSAWIYVLSLIVFLLLAKPLMEDFKSIEKLSPYIVKEKYIHYSYILTFLAYPACIFLASVINVDILLEDWIVFFSLFGGALFCYSLYMTGRHYAVKELDYKVDKRRLGKRSRVKRKDVERMAKEGDVSELCSIHQGDINFRNRELAAELLSQFKNPEIIDCLLNGLTDDEPAVRLASAISLTKFARYDGRTILESTLESGHRVDKDKVLKTLSEIDEEWAIKLQEDYS